MKYLVAVDGSEPGEDALRHAIETADATGADVTAVHVVVPDLYVAGGERSPMDFDQTDEELQVESVEEAESRGQRVLDEAAEIGDEMGRSIETGMLSGEPVDVIVEFAESNGFDAIYVGHRGTSERYEGLVGSTAKEIVGRAAVPVTVVR